MSKALVSSSDPSLASVVRLSAGGRSGPRPITAKRVTCEVGQVGWLATDDATGEVINARPIRHLRDLRHAVNAWAQRGDL